MGTTTESDDSDIDAAWWKEAVVYQIYPRSFDDSDGDGVGDLPGILERLDYVESLGVDVVWLNPIYASPQVDNGYDISDYRAIHDEYGTMDDFETLLAALHERGIRLIMDLVVNHTSDRHEWFRRSRSARDDEYRDYYVWREGEDGGPPNNWASFFGGSAWTRDEATGEYYLHLFDEAQPDLNWRNPTVRDEIYDMMTWWLQKGIDGFRMDVVNLLSKPEGLPDGDPDSSPVGSEHFMMGPDLVDYVDEMHDRVLSKYDVMTVGETPDVSVEDARKLVGPGRLDMVFPFDHMFIDEGEEGPWDIADWDLADLKAVTERWQTGLPGGWNSMYLNNHDQPRIVSRLGDVEEYRVESAKMLATYLLTLWGTPYVYQGEEIGMTNAPFNSIEEFRDVETINRVELALRTSDLSGYDEIRDAVEYWSRDNARTPMQWSDEENAGFTEGTPWLKVNPNYTDVNVAAQEADPDSVLQYYRRLVRLRHERDVLVYGDFELLLRDHPEVFAYLRTLGDERALVVLNFYEDRPEFVCPDTLWYEECDLLVSNYPDAGDEVPDRAELRPYEARVYRLWA